MQRSSYFKDPVERSLCRSLPAIFFDVSRVRENNKTSIKKEEVREKRELLKSQTALAIAKLGNARTRVRNHSAWPLEDAAWSAVPPSSPWPLALSPAFSSVQPTWIPRNKFDKRQVSQCPDGMLEIQIESEVDTWYYQFHGRIWGSDSAQGSSFGGFCVPANTDGGAVYIGPTANPNAGNTKLECQLNGDGTGNCDTPSP